MLLTLLVGALFTTPSSLFMLDVIPQLPNWVWLFITFFLTGCFFMLIYFTLELKRLRIWVSSEEPGELKTNL
jgi:hypothetical protein